LGSKPSPGMFESPDRQVRADEPSDRLNSWKEVAVYLSRDVRTVQRWEKKEELPVHRHLHEKAGSIYAFKSEIDKWWSNRRPRLESEPPPPPGDVFDDTEELEFDSGRRPSVVTDSWYRFKRRIFIAALLLAVIAAGTYISRRLLATKKQVAIMVVPFSNLNVDPYFSAGMTEELMRQVGVMNPARVRVIALPLAALDKLPKDPENVAHDLKPDYVLRGSVQSASEHVRITAQLIRVDDHTQVFDESYEGELKDALKVQADVAQTIATRINLTVSPTLRSEAPPVNPAAHDAYLQGLYAMGPRTPSSLKTALSYFERAITIEPAYAEPYAGIADCYALLGSVETGALPPHDAMPRAKRAALKALQLDPSLAQAHASLAHVLLIYDWDLEGAHKEFQRAVDLNPSYAIAHQWYGLYWNATGKTETAVAEIRQAQQLDPLSPAARTAMAEAYYFGRDFPKAVDESKAALDLNPYFVLGYLNLGRALEQNGQLPEAATAFERGRELSFNGPGMTMFLSHVLALQGKRAQSTELYKFLQEYPVKGPVGAVPIQGIKFTKFTLAPDSPGLQTTPSLDREFLSHPDTKGYYVPALYLAAIQGGLGNKDEAFRLLEKAYDERCEYLIYMDHEPMADFLRSDPRLEPFLKKIGLR
jgi:TolB-like protein/Tfp pilus assembly protein PilF